MTRPLDRSRVILGVSWKKRFRTHFGKNQQHTPVPNPFPNGVETGLLRRQAKTAGDSIFTFT